MKLSSGSRGSCSIQRGSEIKARRWRLWPVYGRAARACSMVNQWREQSAEDLPHSVCHISKLRCERVAKCLSNGAMNCYDARNSCGRRGAEQQRVALAKVAISNGEREREEMHQRREWPYCAIQPTRRESALKWRCVFSVRQVVDSGSTRTKFLAPGVLVALRWAGTDS